VGGQRGLVENGKRRERFIAPKPRDAEEYFAAQANPFAGRGKEKRQKTEERSFAALWMTTWGRSGTGAYGLG
jgi:hypothetical protein